MRKVIDYVLPYREEGEKKEIKIKIDFISNGIMNKYAESQFIVSTALKANNRMAEIFELLAIEQEEKSTGWEKKVEAYKTEYQECVESIEEFNDNGFFKLRMEVLKRILLDNGYKDNELLNNEDFWNDNVDPFYLSQFLETVIYKDMPKKKARAI